MSFAALVVTVLIASPGDVPAARDRVEEVIRTWNADHALVGGIVLMPLRWEVNAIPDLRRDAQSSINEQIVDHADIVIGIFDSRLGTPTAEHPSGTAEELARGLTRGAKVHVYFARGPLPRDLDTAQLDALRAFEKEGLGGRFVGSYENLEDLAAKVRSALEKDVANLRSTGAPVVRQQQPAARKALPVAECRVEGKHGDDEQIAIIVRNKGIGPAEDLRLELASATGFGTPPLNGLGDERIASLAPGETRRFQVHRTAGTADAWRLRFVWKESGIEFEAFKEISP